MYRPTVCPLTNVVWLVVVTSNSDYGMHETVAKQRDCGEYVWLLRIVLNICWERKKQWCKSLYRAWKRNRKIADSQTERERTKWSDVTLAVQTVTCIDLKCRRHSRLWNFGTSCRLHIGIWHSVSQTSHCTLLGRVCAWKYIYGAEYSVGLWPCQGCC